MRALDKAVHITLNGREEALVFTTAALKSVQDKNGDISGLTEAFAGPSIEEWDLEDKETLERKLKAQQKAQGQALEIAWWPVALLANQGRMLEDIQAELLTEQQVALYMLPSDMEPMLQACMDAIAKGTGTYHQPEDAETDPILEEVLKNGEGAGN